MQTIFRNKVALPAIVITIVGLFLVAFMAVPGYAADPPDGSRIYDSIPHPLPGGSASLAFQATQTDEIGDHIKFAGTERGLDSAVVSMTNWACGNDFTWNGTTWIPKVGSAPCTTDASTGPSFPHPITLNLYNVDTTGTIPTLGSVIASVTDTFDIPFRPSATPTLCNGGTRWYSAADNACYNGYNFEIEFDLSSLNITLPDEIVYGVAMNTQTYGATPIGVPGPYNSLNLSLATTPPTVGTDVDDDAIFWDTSTAGWYCDGGVAGTDIFRQDGPDNGECWYPYVPTVRFNLKPAVVSLSPGTPLVCNTDTINIDFSDVPDMYGYEFIVEYDAAKVSADGAFVNSWFDTTDPLEASTPWPATCNAGECKFAATLLSPALPLSGDGPVAQIELTAIAGGSFPLKIKDVVLTNIDGFTIPVTIADDTIDVGVCGTASVSGKISLQGRLTPMDAGSVTLVDTATVTPFPAITVPFDANGNFSVTGIPVLPTGSTYSIRALHGLYLDNLKNLTPLLPGASLTGQNTRLWGGDANNDHIVEIADVTCIGGAFGMVHPAYGNCGGLGSPDINLDLKVNIQDLSIAGGNYNKTLAQNW